MAAAPARESVFPAQDTKRIVCERTKEGGCGALTMLLERYRQTLDRRSCRCCRSIRKDYVENNKGSGNSVAATVLKADVKPRMSRRGEVCSLGVSIRPRLNGDAKCISSEEKKGERIVEPRLRSLVRTAAPRAH